MATNPAGGAAMPRPDRAGARRYEGGGGGTSRLKKLLPLLLGLLVIALVAVLLIALIGGDDGDEGAARPNAGSAAEEAGRLSAGGAAMLPDPSDVLSSHVGEPATGTRLRVLSVNGNEGFFVGSRADRIYIEWGGDVGEDEPSRFQPRRGQRVNLTGPVQRAGTREVDRLKLTAFDEQSVLSQGAFVNADRVGAAR